MSKANDQFEKLSDKEKKLFTIRHSAEHVLTQAMIALFGADKIIMAMGPATADGFYFDFETAEDLKISEEHFKEIEKKMQSIINRDLPITKKTLSIADARKLFEGNLYKQDWLNEIEKKGEEATIYSTGEEFDDLCSGPHAKSTGEIKAFKLLKIAGAYWHGDEKNKMLTRIYGTAFESKEELRAYLDMLEEAKRRDHKKLGVELGLFTFTESVGKGLPLWTPKGSIIRRQLERFIVDEETRRGYLHVYTPDIANLNLYKKSGHYPYYKDSMYAPITIEDEEFMLRPMTCPHHFELFNSQMRSYKELPMRIAEISRLYRYEKSGELMGLLRVRAFSLTDAHIVCRKSQAEQVINEVFDLIEYLCELFGLKMGVNYHYRLSLGSRGDDTKYFKDDASWDYAEDILRKVLVSRKAVFVEAENEAAFYGPKVDVQMKNVNGKEDTAFTNQYDFVMPKRFDMKFINEEGKEEEPIVIHRASLGAIERTVAFLIEHFAGAFPAWLAPIQAVVVPISEHHKEFAQKVTDRLKALDLRVENWAEAESLQKRIRIAEKQRIPYMLIVGDKEIEAETVSVRKRGQVDLGTQSLSDFETLLVDEVQNKKI